MRFVILGVVTTPAPGFVRDAVIPPGMYRAA